MSTGSKYTREDICAFIDGEMTEERAEQIKKAMQYDAALRENINGVREIRSLYRLAYQDTSTTSSFVERANKTYAVRASFLALAASLFIIVGVSLGWLIHSPSVIQPVETSGLKSFFSLKEFILANENNSPTNAILRIKQEPEHLVAALDDIEHLLLKYKKKNRAFNLEVIVHAAGLNILRADVTPVGRRIQDMLSRHKNLSFLACNKTIRRLKDEKGIKVELLPGVLVVPSAIEQVLKRLQEKWAYIQV